MQKLTSGRSSKNQTRDEHFLDWLFREFRLNYSHAVSEDSDLIVTEIQRVRQEYADILENIESRITTLGLTQDITQLQEKFQKISVLLQQISDEDIMINAYAIGFMCVDDEYEKYLSASLANCNRQQKRDIQKQFERARVSVVQTRLPLNKLHTLINTLEDTISVIEYRLKLPSVSTDPKPSKKRHNNGYAPSTQEYMGLGASPGARPEDKILQIRTRVSNIMNRVITPTLLDELGHILTRLNSIDDTECGQLKSDTIDIVRELIDAGVDAIELSVGVPEPNNDNPSSSLSVSTNQQNQIFLQYIRSLRGILTYDLSSIKGGESIGDGNFIAHVWRPFLAHIENIFSSTYISANQFSWSEVSEMIIAKHEGVDNRLRFRNFVQILRTHTEIHDWKTNLGICLDAIVEWRDSSKENNKKQKGIQCLGNILPKLTEHFRETIFDSQDFASQN